MVEGGPIDVLTGDWLAELTMLILARTRAKRPGGGYARTLRDADGAGDGHLPRPGHQGGVERRRARSGRAAPRPWPRSREKLGLSPDDRLRAAATTCCRASSELLAAGIELRHFDTGEPLGDTSRFITANAYLGCWGIVEALERGADIVITGRVTDAAVVCGPAAWHLGWTRDDWDALAGAVVAGHVIECGTQATGGNYSFFTEVPGLQRTGFPWAEIAADGSSVIGKHDGTGGEVSVGTVTSQLLYEIGGPRYLGPDVTARFDTIQLEQVGPDRVRIQRHAGRAAAGDAEGVHQRASAASATTSTSRLAGLDIEAKAALVEAAFWAACPVRARRLRAACHAPPGAHRQARPGHQRRGRRDAAHHASRTPTERKVGRAFSNAMIELAWPPSRASSASAAAPGEAEPFGVYWPAVVPADARAAARRRARRRRRTVDRASVIPTGHGRGRAASEAPRVQCPRGPTVRAPLGRVFGSRSGDKGGNANLGVFARSDAAWAWLDELLTHRAPPRAAARRPRR